MTSYWLAADIFSEVHSVSPDDDLVGGLWSVIATVFVYHQTQRESVTAALTRASGTLVSFALCLIYLSLYSFHPVGLAALIGLGTFVVIAIGRDGDIGVTGITTAVVIVTAALNPHSAWEQPIMRLVDTAIGIAVGLSASAVVTQSAGRSRRGPVILRHPRENL